jgi:hypothetical protein
MTTRAQDHRSEMERSGKERASARKQPPAQRRFTHNDAPRAGEAQASYAIEETNGRPSRKSTRSSSNRMKADAPLQITTRTKLTSPGARAARARSGAQARGVPAMSGTKRTAPRSKRR